MKRTKKNASGPKCSSTASAGVLKCALRADHTGPHSTTEGLRGKGQQGFWEPTSDGRLRVVSMNNGKKLGEWFEDVPAPVVPHVPLTLDDEPQDDDTAIAAFAAMNDEEGDDPLDDEVRSDADRDLAREQREAREAHARELEEDEPERLQPGEHDWEKSNLVTQSKRGQTFDTYRCKACGATSKRYGVAWPPKLDAKQPKNCKPIPAAMAIEPSLTDACPKCDREIGEHDGKKCPKPEPETVSSVGKDRLDHVYALIVASPGKDALSLGRVHRRALKELEQARRIEWRDDGWYPTKPAREVSIGTFPITAIAPGDDRVESPAKVIRIGNHEVDPAAALFPMISDADYPSFRDDIKANGQRKKIVRHNGRILDGRNRLRALIELGIAPQFRDFGSDPSDGADPIAFVVSENIHRRHLNETQRAFVGAELVPMYEAQARARMVAGKRNPAPNSAEGESGEAVEQAAKAVNVGKTSIKAALTVKRDAAPEVLAAARDRGHLKVSAAAELATLPKSEQRAIVEKVGKGEIRSGKVASLVRQEKKRDVVRKINEQRVAPMPLGPFGVIYGDYPWLYDNSDQHEGSRGHMNYPGMPMQDIVAHARATAGRAAKDCVLALWVTNAFVTKIGAVLDAYGAEHRSMFTWPKPKFVHGTWGRGQTEHLVIASIGEPTHTLNEISTLLQPFRPARPGEHSSKPNEVAELLAKHCSGPFLELFARDQREGWICWGAEVDKFTRAA